MLVNCAIDHLLRGGDLPGAPQAGRRYLTSTENAVWSHLEEITHCSEEEISASGYTVPAVEASKCPCTGPQQGVVNVDSRGKSTLGCAAAGDRTLKDHHPYTGHAGSHSQPSSGNLTTLHSFQGSDGLWPRAAVIQASDGSFYGTTWLGGAYGDGTVFRIGVARTCATCVP